MGLSIKRKAKLRNGIHPWKVTLLYTGALFSLLSSPIVVIMTHMTGRGEKKEKKKRKQKEQMPL